MISPGQTQPGSDEPEGLVGWESGGWPRQALICQVRGRGEGEKGGLISQERLRSPDAGLRAWPACAPALCFPWGLGL